MFYKSTFTVISNWSKWLCSVGLLSLSINFASAQNADTLIVNDIDQFVNLVVANNSELKALQFRTLQLDEIAIQSGVLPDPSVGLVALPFPVFTARGAQRAQIHISQAIPFPGKLALKEEAGAWLTKASSYSETTLSSDLVENVRALYADVTLIKRQQALIVEFQQILRNFESVADTRYRVGNGTQQAVLKAQLERNALSARSSILKQTLNSKLKIMSILADRPVLVSSENNWSWTEVAPFDGSTADAINNRTEIQSLNALSERAVTLERLARKEWKPDFTAGLTYFNITEESSPAMANGRDALAISFGVKIPLQRKRLRAQLETTKLLQLEMASKTDQMKRLISEEVTELVRNVSLLKEQKNLYARTLLPQARATLESTLSAYTTGGIGFLDLIDAERMVFDLSWQLEVTSNQLEKQQISLKRAVGSFNSIK